MSEADRLAGAERYARPDELKDYRSVLYERQLHTKSGEVTLKVEGAEATQTDARYRYYRTLPAA